MTGKNPDNESAADTDESSSTSDPLIITRRRKRVARNGDVVTLQLRMTPEGGFVPEPLFDCCGIVSFVLGWGNYLPGLHELVLHRAVGDSVEGVPVDAGWGEHQPDLVVRVHKSNLEEYPWRLGESFFLKGGMQVWVTEEDKEDGAVLLDANPPLAGASYSCSFTVLAVEDAPPATTIIGSSFPDSDSDVFPSSVSSSRYELASFALGCFWGADLAFSRLQGVVGTKVGYSQGITADPTYDEVCEGRTQHRETVLVVFDPSVVTYQELVSLAVDRLAMTAPPLSTAVSSSGLDRLFDDGSPSMQYRHGFYYCSEQQRVLALDEVARTGNRFGVEVLRATAFYDAEEHHQKYLYKRGQSARKGCREPIRCYG
jgi:methionine-S-sulfoxide reductase